MKLRYCGQGNRCREHFYSDCVRLCIRDSGHAGRQVKIWNYEVGPGHPVFIVAEGGSNHGGSLDAALALTEAAADAGASAMKWQLWLSADEMYDRSQFPAEWETTERYKLPVEWLPQLRDWAHERGLAFGLSSFGFGSLDESDKWVDFHKVASIESTWWEFVHAVSKKKKPVIISVGATDESELGDVFGALGGTGGAVLMACTVAYPADIEQANVATGPRFRVHKWGLSDHTLHPTIAPCAAVALGACVIEKHLAGPQFFATPDLGHSLGPSDFREMVEAIRLTEQALGSSEKRIRPSEEKYLRFRRGPRGLRGA